MNIKKREMKYKYFVVYEGRRNEYEVITGNAEMTTNQEIKSIEQIKELEENLKKEIEGANNIVITNYKLLAKIKK